MKYILVLALLSVVSLNAQRQVEVKESITKNQELFVNFKFAQDIKVVHGKTNEIIVKATVNIDDGEGNDTYAIKTENSAGVLKLYSDFGDYFKKRNYYYNGESKKQNCNCCHQTEINYVVIVPENIKVKIKSISGSVFADTYEGDLVTDLISGDVTIKKFQGELRLKTISGVLDITVNKAKLNAKSVTGTIYSNMDFEANSSGKYSNKRNNSVLKQVNGGVNPLVMETVSGDIYIRKG